MRTLASRRLLLLACAASVGLATPALAWGDDGHKVVALIAEHYLTTAAAAKVADLLSGPALPGHPEDRAEVPDTIADRATWADKYRDSDRRNVDGSRYRMTGAWHFADIEVDAPDLDAACFHHPDPGKAFPGVPKNCVVDKIKQFTAVLADPAAARDDTVLALEFLLHFVGDVHQPLHSADRHDQGGNAVNVTYSYVDGGKTHKKTVKLHAYWDKVTVARLGSTPALIAASLIKAMPAHPSAAWNEPDPAVWAMGSFQVAKASAYRLTRTKGPTGATILSASYATQATGAARKQLQLAGYRLATLLNTNLH